MPERGDPTRTNLTAARVIPKAREADIDREAASRSTISVYGTDSHMGLLPSLVPRTRPWRTP